MGLFDGKHAARTFGQQTTGQTTGTGADFQHVVLFEVACHPRDFGGEVQIEQEVLSKRFLGGKIMGRDYVAQWWKVVDAHVRAFAIVSAMRMAAIIDVASAVPRPAMSNAVP